MVWLSRFWIEFETETADLVRYCKWVPGEKKRPPCFCLKSTNYFHHFLMKPGYLNWMRKNFGNQPNFRHARTAPSYVLWWVWWVKAKDCSTHKSTFTQFEPLCMPNTWMHFPGCSYTSELCIQSTRSTASTIYSNFYKRRTWINIKSYVCWDSVYPSVAFYIFFHLYLYICVETTSRKERRINMLQTRWNE